MNKQSEQIALFDIQTKKQVAGKHDTTTNRTIQRVYLNFARYQQPAWTLVSSSLLVAIHRSYAYHHCLWSTQVYKMTSFFTFPAKTTRSLYFSPIAYLKERMVLAERLRGSGPGWLLEEAHGVAS
jgi:hypothetical protein